MNYIERLNNLSNRIQRRMKNTVTVSLNQSCLDINRERNKIDKQRKQRKKQPLNNEVIRSFNNYPK